MNLALVEVHADVAPVPRNRTQARVQRRDLYALVHKALRLALTDTLVRVGRLDVDDPRDVWSAAAAVRELVALYRMHLESEERFIHPLLEATAPGSARRTAAEHVDHRRAFDRLESGVRAVECSTGASRTAAAAALYRRLTLFAAESFVHMHGEEVDNNAVIWAACSDEELAAIERRIGASFPPAQMNIVLRWLAPAMNPAERASFFAHLRAKLPPPAFAGAMSEVIGELDAEAKHKLLQALGA